MKRYLGFSSVLMLSVTSIATAQPDDDSLDAMTAFGLQYESAWELYSALEAEADGGQPLAWDNLPDWSGIHTRGRGGLAFDPDRPEGVLTRAPLTPEYQARLAEALELRESGIEFDPLSTCAPPGFPRWLAEPFLREFVVTPDQTWLMNEMVNDTRRIYTDGREHMPEAMRLPLYNGDSIGFWDGHRLVVHTNQLQAGRYQRSHPEYSEQMETVEIWQKTDERNIEVDVWMYDPVSLEAPWYARQTYTKLTDPEQYLRIRYWHCAENQNNATFMTEDGATDFTDFTFTTEDDR